MGQAIGQFLKTNKAGIDMGSTALGGGLQIGAQIGAGMDDAAQAAYKASVLKNNAYLANEAAAAAIHRGQIEAGNRDIQTAQTIGAQKATLAGHGVVVNQDTGLELSVDAARIGKLDEQQIIQNANRQALALKMQGINFSTQAKAAKAEGSYSQMAGLMGGLGTALTTGTKVAAKWMLYNQDQTTTDLGN